MRSATKRWQVPRTTLRLTPEIIAPSYTRYWHEDHLVSLYESKHNMTYQSYSPLGAPDHMAAGVRNWSVVPTEQPVVSAIAAKYRRSPAQVVLKWAWQLGVTANPRTQNVTQMQENLAALASDWSLSRGDMAALGDIEGRGTAPPEKCGPPLFPGIWTCANKVCPDPRAIK